ncbi:hypothetical protein ACFSQZ_03290 [Rubritalea spongiae]|uniref:Uncharacterized protein n=2 Tax=Rubritalea spongiae TaxID=430797 RepID=A0ABW5DZD5_9BACT
MQSGKNRQEAEGLYTRSAHSKTVGLMTAEFRVEPNLPEECRIGVFAKPRIYKAFVRASHSSPSPQADKKKDARGMAIKLLGVDGERFVKFNKELATQDFILISWPAFFFANLKCFVPAAKLFIEKRMFAVLWLLLKTGQYKTISYVAQSFKN